MFEVLGPVVVRDGDARIEIASPRQRALLVTLLARPNQPIVLPDVEQALWGTEPPASARASLHKQMLRLRRSLTPRLRERLRTVPLGYLIEVHPGELDEQEFLGHIGRGRAALQGTDWAAAVESFGAALELWRGDPGDGLPDTPPLALRNRRLADLRLEALEGRIEAGLHQGKHRELLPEIQILADEHPMVESFHSALMLAFYRCGRQGEALAVFRRLRTTLVEELGVEPSAEVRDLHSSLLNADAALAAPAVRRDTNDEQGKPNAPRQLPADTPAFVGRADELELFAELAAEQGGLGTPTICVIDGMGGVGKSALAVHVAHRLAPGYPDGQLFLDLHGYTQGHRPRTAEDALGWLLRALGIEPERIPHEGEQAAALYRQRLADTRTLIVLDNALTEAQVRPLLPGSGSCLVLITSRRRLKALDDAHNVSLDLLAPSDAVTLLHAAAGTGRLPADETLQSEIAGLCGYLPLALRIAGALMRHRPAWPLEHLVRKLSSGHGRIPALSDGVRDLAAVFDLSYADLDEAQQLMWRRLGLIPGPDLDAYAAAALLEIAPSDAETLLQNLVDHNLLTEYRPGRYRLHDLLRARARTLAATDPQAERDDAVDRLLNYYAHTARNASIPTARYTRPVPDGAAPAHIPALPDPAAALAWLRIERENLEAAFGYARVSNLHQHFLALSWGLAEILTADGPFNQPLPLLEATAGTAVRLGHRAAYATALTDLGRVRRHMGDLPAARDALTRALDLHRAHGNHLGEAATLDELGDVRFQLGEMGAAADALTSALEIYRLVGDRRGEGAALTGLGVVRRLTGDLHGSADALTLSLELHREVDNRRGETHALISLGYLRYLVGNLISAADSLTAGLEICRANGYRNNEGLALMYLGAVWRRTGELSSAAAAIGRALEIFSSAGSRINEALALVELGQLRQARGDLGGAADSIGRALEICREGGQHLTEAWALNYQAGVFAAAGDRRQAFAIYERALAMNQAVDKPDGEALALEGLAECHLAAFEDEAGISGLQQALALFRRLGMKPDVKRLQARLAGFGAD